MPTITELEDYIEGLKITKQNYLKAVNTALDAMNEEIQKAEAQLDDLLRCEE